MNYHLKNSIRFRLTFFYSLLTLTISIAIIIGFNIFLINYFEHEGQIARQKFQATQIEDMPSLDSVKEIRDRDLYNIHVFSAFLIFPIIVLSVLFGLLATNRFLSPIQKLNNDINKLTTDNLGEEIQKKYNDEIGQLIDSFNLLSMNLFHSFNAQKEFVQDASHELKTPLTIMKLKVDTISHDKNAKIEEYKKVNTDILNTINSLNNLTDDLFMLTTNDKSIYENVDLKEIINSQLVKLNLLIESKNIKVSTDFTAKKSTLKCNRNNLERVIFNLIENAIKYGDGIIKISLSQTDSQIILEIENNGNGISQEETAKIFQRFYRVDKSRSRKTGGVGLGLSIVKKIIEEHSGEIVVSSKQGSTIFKVLFPN